MNQGASNIWYPEPSQAAASNISDLVRLLGVSDYDELYRFSIDDPAAYWQAINAYCGIVWDSPYREYVDLSRGKQFPAWFAGGTLNWTDTIFGQARDPLTAARTAVVAETETGGLTRISYAELCTGIERFSSGLQARGIRRGDRMGLLMEPCVEAVISMLGLAHMGAVIVPLFSGFGVDPIVTRLASSTARGLIATSGFHRRGRWIDRRAVVEQAADQLGLEFLILKTAVDDAASDSRIIPWSSVASGSSTHHASAKMTPDEPLMIFYTSGTTGKPKGTVHTHAGFPLKIAHDAVVHFDMKAGDVFFWPADMGWLAGPLIIACTLMRGATMVAYDGAPDSPDWSRMSRIIERHRVTIFASAPTMIRGLAAHADVATAGDISSIRLLITGGEVIDAEHFVLHQRSFGRSVAPMINYSGGTEVSGCILSSVIVKPIPPGAFNTVSPGIVADVVDGQGLPLVDTVGELAITEPFVGMTRSFWNDDERYLETYWQKIPGMWIHGDLAIKSKDGSYLLRGRSDDTIKVAGKRLGPAEVEDLALELVGIEEAAAIGVDDAEKGQMLVVFAVAAQACDIGPDLGTDIANHIEQRLGRAFRPQRVHILEQLPKTRNGKVMRRLIRSVYCQLPMGDLSSLDNPTALDEIARAARDAGSR
jgi:acetyl-CoA synthetase